MIFRKTGVHFSGSCSTRITVAADRRGPYLRRNPGSKRDARGIGKGWAGTASKFCERFIAVDHAFSPRGTALALITIVFASGAYAQEAPIRLVPHRAVYDLSLEKTRGNSQVAAVRGRILYDFNGNACEGYSLEF